MFRDGSYATVWKVDEKGRVCQASLSTSRKDKDTGEYYTDFRHNFVTFIGEAAKRAALLKERDRIKIKSCAVGNKYDKEKNKEYWNCYIYDFEMVDNNKENAPVNTNASSENEDEDLPF
ncbi:MAG: hypothetical protein RSC97_10890 [Eubacterium sp.]